MLTQNQEGYLNTVPEDRVAHVVAFDPAAQTAAKEIIRELESALPSAQVIYIGSSKLGIAGENDIDLTVLSGDRFEPDIEIIQKMYGEPVKVNLKNKFAKWEFFRNNFPVELYLGEAVTPNLQEQLDVQKILENDPALRSEYEQIKLASDGLSWKEYIRRKYEFWNKILGINQ